jgi:hypothetical protein
MCEQVLCNVVILNLLAATAISGMPILVVRYQDAIISSSPLHSPRSRRLVWRVSVANRGPALPGLATRTQHIFFGPTYSLSTIRRAPSLLSSWRDWELDRVGNISALLSHALSRSDIIPPRQQPTSPNPASTSTSPDPDRLAHQTGRHLEGKAGCKRLQWQRQKEAEEGAEAHYY